MATLGTKKFYKSLNSKTELQNQVLKNSGYVSIVLHSAYYKSKGNFWQRIFGGTDKIALTSSITYKSTNKTIEAKSVVDKRKVKANRNHSLGLSRLIALKVPTIADGLELKVELTAVKDDNFENGLDLMNSEEFQKPLQLASQSVGQILSVTSVVKKIFTGIENPSILESTYAGIISKDKVENPIQKERLTDGYIIIIANNSEDESFLSEIDQNKLSVEGDGLKYKNEPVTHTNLVFAITFEHLKGPDQESSWFKKYQRALNKLDDIIFTTEEEGRIKILQDAQKLWVEGNTILFEDPTYIDKEKRSIKLSYLKKIKDRYSELTRESEDKFIKGFSNEQFETLELANSNQRLNEKSILLMIEKESSKYFKELGKANMIFPS